MSSSSQPDFWTEALTYRKSGPRRIYRTPADLCDAAASYFTWANNNPMKVHQVFHNRGEIVHAYVMKPRVFTVTGLCAHLGITMTTLDNYRIEPDLREACEIIDNIIYTQKFEGGASDIFNANMISRSLGLTEKSEVTGADGGPIKTEAVVESANKFSDQLQRLIKRKENKDG